MIAKATDLIAGDFVHTLGDAHLYLNHLNQVDEQLAREPNESPRMIISRESKNIFDYKYEDFSLEGYNYHPHISAPIAI